MAVRYEIFDMTHAYRYSSLSYLELNYGVLSLVLLSNILWLASVKREDFCEFVCVMTAG